MITQTDPSLKAEDHPAACETSMPWARRSPAYLSCRDKADVLDSPVERSADGEVKDVGLEPSHEVFCHSKYLLLCCCLTAGKVKPVAQMLSSCPEDIRVNDTPETSSLEDLYRHSSFVDDFTGPRLPIARAYHSWAGGYAAWVCRLHLSFQEWFKCCVMTFSNTMYPEKDARLLRLQQMKPPKLQLLIPDTKGRTLLHCVELKEARKAYLTPSRSLEALSWEERLVSKDTDKKLILWVKELGSLLEAAVLCIQICHYQNRTK